ncbi:hypothetical protein WA026_013635 [Henosepilachna vigintioctopunctata]|uniref:Uncharacterized protein n=1 Tax=Henosepilachna vigintioctopunctata TaxID=420089 RepID=A0AAW1V1M6_9CUCU
MALSNNNQAAFWEAMKEKYEKRNENLRQQEICLRERLEQLKQLMEQQQTNDDCDCVPEKLEKPSLVQCLVQKGKELILGSCTCGDPKIGQEFLCACHIVDPKIPLNFDSNAGSNQVVTSPEGCLNKECDFYNPQIANPSEDPSIFSLKTTDIYYMDKLAELVKAEKCMQNKITELENKERCYITALQDVNELMKKKPKNDPLRKEFDRIVECLEGENRKLKNELEDLRLELKHCFERVEGPLRRSLENQREKCADMEKKLKNFQEKMTNKEDNYLKEINEIKAKLCQACCTMVDLNKVNSRLKNDLVSLENKCLSLEDELVKQQLKEAENILKFKKVICRRSVPVDSFNRGDDSEQDLEHIARKLSETLKEVYPCVNKVPTELTETVKGIKQLTELVGEKEQRRKKRNGKVQSGVMPTTSQIESFCCCYNIDESCPASAVVVKRASTAPEVAVKDTVDEEKLLEIEPKKIADENVVETASKACECEIEYERSSQQTATPDTAEQQLSKKAEDVAPPQEQIPKTMQDVALSVCSCYDEILEKAAPPQEEIPKTTQDVALSVCSCYDEILEKAAPPQEEIPKTMQDVALSVCSCGDEVSINIGKTEEQTSKNIQDTTEYSCPANDQARRKSGTVEDEAQSNCACGDQESTIEAAEEEASKKIEDEIDSNCSCDDQDSKKTGPSEEVIAVKDLEPLCPAGICDLQNKLKLKVDTTCDIIDMPPNDIHVVTTLAKTGSLEITTEGPPGVIETKVNYLPCGKIEIVTKLIDRNKLTSFLEGKLLPLPDQQPESTCNDSKTCGGQCEISTGDCVEQENNDKKSTNGTKPTDQLLSSAPYGSVNIHNNFVLVGETRIDHVIENEWKNTKFDNDAKEECDVSNLMSNVKRMHKNKEPIYSEDSPNKEFRLASRPSLTDIEKYSHENVPISGDSLNSFVHPDALETISECDEDENSTRNDLKQYSEDTFEKEEVFDRSDASCNTCQDILGDLNIRDEDLSDACCNTSKVTIGDFSMKDEDLSEASCNTSEEAIPDLNMKDEVLPDHRKLKMNANQQIKT